MNFLKRLVTGLGNQTAPFGFAPNDPEAAYKAGLGYVGDVGANLLANNQGGVNPFANLGASLQQAKADSTTRNKEQYTAQRLMEEAAAKRQEREAEAQRQKMIEDQISQLPPELQGLARIAPDKVFGSMIDQQFAKPEQPNLTADMQNWLFAQKNPGFAEHLQQGQGGGDGAKSYAPIPYKKPDGTVGYGVPYGDGNFIEVPAPEGTSFLGPFEKASDAAAGKVQGEAEAILPAATIEAQTVAKKAQTIINDANLDNAVGYDYWRPDWAVPNDVIVTRSRIQELMGGAFLQGVVLLQGTGPLTEKEGAAAASSLSRMELAMKSSNPKDFKEALRDYSEAVNNGVAKLAGKARKPVPNLSVPNVGGGSPTPVTGGSMPDLSNLSDAELEAIANGQ
jgi:hypothetical protein